MRVQLLVEGDMCEIVATMDGDVCPALAFLDDGEESTRAYRQGLMQILVHVAERGLQGVPSAWWHEANKKEGIYEFVKGPLRLFFFKGDGRQVAVCTSGLRKKGPKADKAAVNEAAKLRKQYDQAVNDQQLEVINDQDE